MAFRHPHPYRTVNGNGRQGPAYSMVIEKIGVVVIVITVIPAALPFPLLYQNCSHQLNVVSKGIPIKKADPYFPEDQEKISI